MESGRTEDVIRSPVHPYTAALLDCVPGPRVEGRRKTGIEGNVPRVDHWFQGCRFAPRCKHAQPDCQVQPVDFAYLTQTQGARCLHPLK